MTQTRRDFLKILAYVPPAIQAIALAKADEGTISTIEELTSFMESRYSQLWKEALEQHWRDLEFALLFGTKRDAPNSTKP